MEEKDKVVNIRSKMPHMTGGARCLDCDWLWVAVAEIGVISLDCPKCAGSRGVWRGICFPEKGGAFECNCGCMHFFISREYIHCALCGISHEFDDGFNNAS